MSKETKPVKESKTKADPRLRTRPKGEVQLTEKELDKVVGGSTVLGGWNRVKNVVG